MARLLRLLRKPRSASRLASPPRRLMPRRHRVPKSREEQLLKNSLLSSSMSRQRSSRTRPQRNSRTATLRSSPVLSRPASSRRTRCRRKAPISLPCPRTAISRRSSHPARRLPPSYAASSPFCSAGPSFRALFWALSPSCWRARPSKRPAKTAKPRVQRSAASWALCSRS